MSDNVLIVGGKSNGNKTSWFGHKVFIDREKYFLHKVYFSDGTMHEYYVRDGMTLVPSPNSATVRRIEAVLL